MNRPASSVLAIFFVVFAVTASGVPVKTVALAVTVTPNLAAHRVDVSIGGRPFTSYIWPERLKKPVLYPLQSASGALVTRGWPLDPRPGERVDHPHQVGLWFVYGDVNGVDFWNNSEALTPGEQAKMGVIVHRRVVTARGGADDGTFVADMDWIGPGGVTFLHERATFQFRGDAASRTVDRISTLTAADRRVVFDDNKEGLFGMRVARQLEQPSATPDTFTDSSGRVTPVKVLDNTGVTGSYTSSEGKTGDAVWGTRSKWTMLTGQIGPGAVTLAILDHPENFGFPTYWHARGYGLFAANPIGQKALSEGKQPPLKVTMEPGASVTFRHRLLILDGKATPDRFEREHMAFAAGKHVP